MCISDELRSTALVSASSLRRDMRRDIQDGGASP